jgi:hypothetical protein
MREHISFAIAVTMVGLAIFFWMINTAGLVEGNADVARPKVELSAGVSNPNLPFQVLAPAY